MIEIRLERLLPPPNLIHECLGERLLLAVHARKLGREAFEVPANFGDHHLHKAVLHGVYVEAFFCDRVAAVKVPSLKAFPDAFLLPTTERTSDLRRLLPTHGLSESIIRRIQHSPYSIRQLMVQGLKAL